MSMNVLDEWLTTKEAAKYLKVSHQYLEKLRCVGGSPRYSKRGARVLYRRPWLDAWAEEGVRTSTADQGRAA
jgi:excisionase family DNA binding protein